MARIIQQQNNTWGSQGATTDVQRADLWVVNFRDAITGLNNQITAANGLDKLSSELEPFHVLSVNLPPLATKTEEIRRDSRPYKMPAWDEPVGEVKMVLYYDTPIAPSASKVYKMLDTWRAFVRAGRGAMGNEVEIALNDNFRIDYAFDITLVLLKGNSNPTITVQAAAQTLQNTPQLASGFNATNSALSSLGGGEVSNDLEQTAIYLLENAWLSTFRITDLDYTRGNELSKIEATFVVENILNEPIAA